MLTMDNEQGIQLTLEDKNFFYENGYWVSPVLFSADMMSEFRLHYEQVLKGTYETGIEPEKRNYDPDQLSEGVVKITNCVWSDSRLSQLILNKAIGRIAANLLGVGAIRFWRDHLWYKPPESGNSTIVGWHQDYFYWQCAEPANLITAWVALSKADIESGCLEMVPGSHKWGLQPVGDLYSHDLEGLQEKFEKSSGKEFKTVPCVLEAGSVLFHHCLTIHGSRPNISHNPRLSMSIHLFPEGTRYRKSRSIKPFSNERFFSGQDGDFFAGPFFPVLYREGNLSNSWDINI